MTQPSPHGPYGAAPPPDGSSVPPPPGGYPLQPPPGGYPFQPPPGSYPVAPPQGFPPAPPYGYGPPAVVVPSPLPERTSDYQQMLRTPRQRWWKGALMIASFVAAYLLVSLVLQIGAVSIDVARGRVATEDLLNGKLTLTPTLLLSVNLTNAVCIPISMLLQRAFFGQRGNWLHSVVGRFRWRVLGRGSLIVLPVFALYLAVTLVATPGGVVRPSAEALVLLVVVLLTTPLQAAGEEYGARGLIARGAGSWVAGRGGALLVSTLVSSVAFMFAHGAGDPWLNAFYFFFGVVLSLVTWRTGGLEIAVLVHVANNLIAFGSGILLGQDLSSALDRSAGTGSPAVLLPAAALVVSAGGVWLWARASGLTRTYSPAPAALPSAEPEPTRA